MSLKELMKEEHDAAENHPFIKKLFSGNITKQEYSSFLYNQKYCYAALEDKAEELGLLVGIELIKRATKISKDLEDLQVENKEVYNSTIKYCDYINTCSKEQLLAHIYVRHFGDLSGGQLIAKRVPGSGRMYQFGDDPETIKNILRAKLDDSLADEAIVCFEFAGKLFEQMLEFVEFTNE